MSNLDTLKKCPNCDADAEVWEPSENVTASVCCSVCPLGLEDSRMSIKELSDMWNNLPRRYKDGVV